MVGPLKDTGSPFLFTTGVFCCCSFKMAVTNCSQKKALVPRVLEDLLSTQHYHCPKAGKPCPYCDWVACFFVTATLIFYHPKIPTCSSSPERQLTFPPQSSKDPWALTVHAGKHLTTGSPGGKQKPWSLACAHFCSINTHPGWFQATHVIGLNAEFGR